MFLNFTNPYILSNVNTLQSSEQDNTLIYLDEHRIYRYIPYYTIIVSVGKKPSDFRNKMYKMYYIFGEYKVQDSELALLYYVGAIISDIKYADYMYRYLSYSNIP